MAKGQQRSNKEAKKPKKDKSTAKPLPSSSVMAPAPIVVPDRKKK